MIITGKIYISLVFSFYIDVYLQLPALYFHSTHIPDKFIKFKFNESLKLVQHPTQAVKSEFPLSWNSPLCIIFPYDPKHVLIGWTR